MQSVFLLLAFNKCFEKNFLDYQKSKVEEGSQGGEVVGRQRQRRKKKKNQILKISPNLWRSGSILGNSCNSYLGGLKFCLHLQFLPAVNLEIIQRWKPGIFTGFFSEHIFYPRHGCNFPTWISDLYTWELLNALISQRNSLPGFSS